MGKGRLDTQRIAAAALLALAVLAAGKTMLAGLEIDEQYALSIGWRLVQGDALFATMWEPHQLSALPAAALLWLYTALTGTTTGVLLFVRAVMLLAKAGLSAAFYRVLQPALPRRTAFLGAVALFLYTPKWFLGPDYISQQFHFTLAAFLCFTSYQTRRGLWRAALGGVAMSFGVLAFPQSVFAAPVIFAGLFLLGRRSGEKRAAGVPAGALTALAACGVCAAAFLCYVLQALSPAELLERAGLILHDPQYDFTTAERLALLAGQAMSVARFLAKPALAALALTALAAWLGRRRGGRTADWPGLWLALFAGLATLLCLGRAVVTHGLDERTFVPVLALLGLRAFRRCRGTPRAALFWLGYLPGLAAYLFILRSTLLGLSATFMYLTWPGLCAVLALAMEPPAPARREDPRLWADGLLGVFIAFLLACRLLLVLTTGWQPRSVFDTRMELLTTGPAAWTWVDSDTADIYHALEQALAPHAGERVLLSTGDVEGLAFLMDGGSLQAGQASVISSTDSDARFAQYYELLPDKAPDVIVYNHNCVRDLEEFHAWLESYFAISDRRTVTVGTARLEVLTVAGLQ